MSITKIGLLAALVLAVTPASVAGQPRTLADAGILDTIHTFKGKAGGTHPTGLLLYRSGALFGTTGESGGPKDYGVAFSIDPASGAETVLYRFTDRNHGEAGFNPATGLIEDGHYLYGTTENGGASAAGTVFKINPATGAEKVIYSFMGGADGSTPVGLIYAAGMLYGVTNGGGQYNGTVFAVDPATGTETVLHTFAGGADGALLVAGVNYQGGVLYGTTIAGGGNGCGGYGCGVVFTIDPVTGTEAVLYSFAGGADGEYPESALTFANGMLYGTTTQGGTSGDGTVFSVDPATGAEAVLYSFNPAHGESPTAALLYRAGRLYGTTRYGGASGAGTLFALSPATGKFNVLHSFTNRLDGGNPYAGLIVQGGNFYGTTGTTVFRYGK